MTKEKRLLSRDEAAIYLGISPHTLTAWAKVDKNKVPFLRLGRRILYDQVDLDNFIEAQKTP